MKASTNTHFGSRYADLAAVLDAVRAPLAKHGLVLMQHIRDDVLVTIVAHSSGESVELAPVRIAPAKADMQAYGSAITYARRYSLQTALAVPAEDDDGNAASEPATQAARAPQIDPKVLQDATKAAASGIEAYAAWFKASAPDVRRAILPKHESFKKAAADFDKGAA